jgi:DNA modification methylase
VSENGLDRRTVPIGEREFDGRRNKRSVWTLATQPYAGAHFATFPPKLIEPCIIAGCPEGGTVLDPFAGSGTTGMVALRHGRSFVGMELSAVYAAMARWRIRDDAPLLNGVAEAA